MHAVYVENYRYITIAPSGVATIGLECGCPYKEYTAWVFCGSTPTLSVQPKFGGFNNGAAVVVAATGPTKVFQVAAGEIRPSTNIKNKNPNDEDVAPSLKSELVITNNAVTAIKIGVYMVAVPAN